MVFGINPISESIGLSNPPPVPLISYFLNRKKSLPPATPEAVASFFSRRSNGAEQAVDLFRRNDQVLRASLPSHFQPNCHRMISARLSRVYQFDVVRFFIANRTKIITPTEFPS
jgi:hypothetical protein